MSDRKLFIYSSEDTPRLLRPALPDEDHIWNRPDGVTLKLVEGEWVEFDPNA